MADLNHFGFVLATKMLVDGKRKVGYMYHEAGDNRQDSGWRFFCGEEDDAYVNTPENIGVYSIKTILALDPEIQKYLDEPEGFVWEKESTEGE